MINRQVVKKLSGKIVGYIDTDTLTKKQTAKDIRGGILGYYIPNRVTGSDGVTKLRNGKIVGTGNNLSMLLWDSQYNRYL